jgi:Flp pilus assembly pilin Flp
MRDAAARGEDGRHRRAATPIEDQMPRVHVTRELGQTAAEYAVVLAVITLTIIVTLAWYADEMRLAIKRVVDIWPG